MKNNVVTEVVPSNTLQSTAANPHNQAQNSLENDTNKSIIDSKAKWYWFCDENNQIQWIPYRDDHQSIIQQAWVNNKPHVIIMERFKIDFKRDGSVPAGLQYNYQISNSWRREVMRGTPDAQGTLNGIFCATQPR
jgi:hypothetical protein